MIPLKRNERSKSEMDENDGALRRWRQQIGKTVVDAAVKVHSTVDGKAILELKSVEQLSKAHHRQLFTYLKLKELRLGTLLNFGASLMKDSIKWMTNGLDDEKLGVFGSLREPQKKCQQNGDLNSDSLWSSP
jgi:hypothetical protein